MVYRLFVIFFACIAASLAAGAVITFAVMFPAVSNLVLDGFERSVLGYLFAFGAIFISFFAFLPTLIVIAVGESLGIRTAIYYAVAGAAVAAFTYMSSTGWNTLALTVDGFARRELEVMTGAGIAAGFIYWTIAGRNAGVWREPPQARDAERL